MSDYAAYLLKANLCLAAFYLPYAWLLKRTTFFSANRAYLLAGLLLSWLLPLISFAPAAPEMLKMPAPLWTPPVREAVNHSLQTIQNITYDVKIGVTRHNDVSFLLPLLYLLGLAAGAFRLVRSMAKTFGQIRKGRKAGCRGLRIVRTKSGQACAFFRYILLPESLGDIRVIEHERTHVRQWHWVDLLLAECNGLLMWFNPFAFLYKQAFRLQHEYLADRQVVGHLCPASDYLGCLLRQAGLAGTEKLVSPFSCRTIKKRIIMITKKKTSKRYYAAYLLLFPVAGLLSFTFGTTEEKPLLQTAAFVEADGPTAPDSAWYPNIYPVPGHI
ncbi:MAG: hypothetical protein LBL81_00870, partial [Tannerella sp.]|nr:hypothetical protein [Tannerella sp.]